MRQYKIFSWLSMWQKQRQFSHSSFFLVFGFLHLGLPEQHWLAVILPQENIKNHKKKCPALYLNKLISAKTSLVKTHL